MVAELLRTERLIIRDWTDDDVAAALTVYGRPEVARWLTPAIDQVRDIDDMAKLLQRWMAESRDGEAGLGHWAITLAEDGTLIGGVSLHPLPVDEQDVEIGWQIAPEHWGNGYAREAMTAVTAFAAASGFRRLLARTHLGNRRSDSLLAALLAAEKPAKFGRTAGARGQGKLTKRLKRLAR